jgi:GT2 family glycosyltransferase
VIVPVTQKARVAVIVLTLDQCDKTLTCLESLAGLADPDFHVLVWDNGSVDGTEHRVRDRHPEVLVEHSPRNLGVGSGRNAAARLAMDVFAPEYLLFLDNDMVVTEGFVAALVDALDAEPEAGQAQAKLRFMDDPQRLNDGGGCKIQFWRGLTIPVGYRELDEGQRDERKECVACGGAMIVRSLLFEELGGFDATFDPFGPEDIDFSLRLKKAGHRALYVPAAMAYHEVSSTFEGGAYTELYAQNKTRNWLVFMLRHAPWHEKVVFLVFSVPLLALRVLVREGRAGNLGAFRGLARGLLEFLKQRARGARDGAGSPGGD